MRAVWSWLNELVELERAVSVDEAGATFTALGLEVERVERIAEDFTGVVVAEVVDRRPHPEADKLTLVKVIDAAGGAATEVVCGASNVPGPGGRVLWARPGATLPGGVTIGKKKLKGVESAGMLCSERELGLGDDHEGIWVLDDAERAAPLGSAAQDGLALRDAVFELSTAANRPDLLGQVGLARELVARLGGRLVAPAAPLAEPEGPGPGAAQVSVTIDDADGCPRYTARVIEGLTVAPSPRWLRRRLRAVGVRALSNLIDVTNYVMFETGQPLHAFDLAALRGAAIRVRRARPGERMTTLDGVERALEPADLLICDGERPVALAGVMGGQDSEVAEGTRRVLLESAAFLPGAVRRTSRRLGLRSEASQRFERGVDPAGAERVSARAAHLLATLGGGQIVPGVVDIYPRRPSPAAIRFRPARASQLTGVALSPERSAELLGRLGVAVSRRGDELDCTPPSHRIDLEREVDLIEDVIRLHGYEHVPATLPSAAVPPRRAVDVRPELTRRALTSVGLDEAITFGFTSPDRIAALGFRDGDWRGAPLALKNPMTVDHSVMRTALVANLLGALARNLKHQVGDVRLFELGSVFEAQARGQLPREHRQVGGVLCGPRPGWLADGGELDFFDAKTAVVAVLTELLGAGQTRARIVAGHTAPWLHPGVSARVELDGNAIGVLGEVHPRVRAAFEIEARCFAFELGLDAFEPPAPRQMQAIPRFPATSRDVSFLIDAGRPAAEVGDLLTGSGEGWIERVVLLEDFRDPAYVPPGKKGMLWSITYRSHERTLTDAEVEERHEALVAEALTRLGATRR